MSSVQGTLPEKHHFSLPPWLLCRFSGRNAADLQKCGGCNRTEKPLTLQPALLLECILC